MGEIRVPQAKYSLLLEKQAKYPVHKCIVVFIVVVTILFFLIYGIYALINDTQENAIHFPMFPTQVPPKSIHRAMKYNNHLHTSHSSQKAISKFRNSSSPSEDFKIVCYYNFPSKETDVKQLRVEKLDPNLCTHINLAFASIVNNSINLDEHQLNVSASVMDLKKVNKKLKVLLSVGGSGNDGGFPEMVLNHENRKTFIRSILSLVKEHKFDGVDLDWEFPNEPNKNDAKQRMHFTQLLYEIRNEINRQEKHKFLLSLAVAAPEFLVDISYDVSYMNQYVDFINLMSYDFHFYTKLTPYTGINSPLYPNPEEIGYISTLNINYSANYWSTQGMDKNKIIIGLPTYGHTYTLMNSVNNGLKAPASGYGKLGGGGFADYQQICWFLNKNKIIPVFDDTSKSPYASKLTEWISYESVDSVTFKAEYIKKNNFGGAMLYALNTDDYDGTCSQNTNNKLTFPLTRKVKEILTDEEL